MRSLEEVSRVRTTGVCAVAGANVSRTANTGKTGQHRTVRINMEIDIVAVNNVYLRVYESVLQNDRRLYLHAGRRRRTTLCHCWKVRRNHGRNGSPTDPAMRGGGVANGQGTLCLCL